MQRLSAWLSFVSSGYTLVAGMAWVCILHLFGYSTVTKLVLGLISLPALWMLAPLLFASVLAARLRSAFSGEQRALVGAITLELDNEGLRVKSSVSTSQYAWASVPKLRRTTQHLGLFVTSATAVIIPRRAFPSPDDEQRFCEEITRRTGHAFVDGSQGKGNQRVEKFFSEPVR